MIHTTPRIAAALALTLAVATSCGSSSEEGATPTTANATADDSVDSETPETTAASDENAEFCDAASTFGELFTTPEGVELTEGDMQTMDGSFAAMAESAPAEIEEDMKVLAPAWEKLATATDEELGELARQEVFEAMDNAFTFAEDECGVDLGEG